MTFESAGRCLLQQWRPKRGVGWNCNWMYLYLKTQAARWSKTQAHDITVRKQPKLGALGEGVYHRVIRIWISYLGRQLELTINSRNWRTSKWRGRNTKLKEIIKPVLPCWVRELRSSLVDFCCRGNTGETANEFQAVKAPIWSRAFYCQYFKTSVR